MEKKYDYLTSEAALQKFWIDEQIYAFNPVAGPLYSVDTPPPTVSGALHIGHIFSYTQTDIIARYKRMSGHAVFYPFGFDDNGLPTERYVEKKLDIQAHSMPRSQFINLCLQETVGVEEQFKLLWQRIGLSVDWSYAYSTIAPNARKISQESFIDLYKKGYIYRRHEPALYCTACRTSVAQAELDDAEKTSLFNEVHFTTTDGQKITIATTRPELLSSCVAVLYNPSDERYQNLANKKAIVPIFGNEVPLIADESVEPQKGTGLVMCCTFGDKTDIAWFKKYTLPYRQSVGHDGRWLPTTGILAGLKVEAARERILQELQTLGLLGEQKSVTRAVNVHERCKKEIEIIALSQWFLSLLPFKEKFIQEGNKINWYPAHMKARYTNWVENLTWDWCLSRQRFYGIPFPAWHCENGHILLASAAQLPVDPQETPYAGSCPECGSTTIKPDTDVMDTWNTSSLTPQICFSLFDKGQHSPFDRDAIAEFLPMSMRPQAHDIIRTWAFDTIVKAYLHYGMIPWSDIVISGHVLSDSKEKLSKSKENSKTTPENLLKTYPADVIRYWTASGRLGQDIAFSENQLKIGQRLITKIWNAFIFVHEHTQGARTKRPAELGQVNEWILHQSSHCSTLYKNYFDSFEFSLALDTIEQFFWHDFCDNYLEFIKDQFFKPENYSAETLAATRWTLATVGFKIIQLYAPYLPHVTESIYQEVYKEHHQRASLHVTTFDTASFDFQKSAAALMHVKNAVTQIRKLKTEKQLSLKTPLKELAIHAPEAICNDLNNLAALIKGVTAAEHISFVNEATQTELQQHNDQWIATINLH